MRARALALTAVGTLLVSGCTVTVPGIASPTVTRGDEASAPDAAELADAAADALLQAGSLHVRGGMSLDGVATEIEVWIRGTDATGTISWDGVGAELLSADDEVYMRGTAETWMAQGLTAGQADRAVDTWVLLRRWDAAAFDPPTLAGIAGGLSDYADAEVTRGELEGRPVWLLRASDGFVLSIAAEGTPYPLRLASGDVDPGAVRYDEFGTVAPIVPPAHFVEFDDLG